MAMNTSRRLATVVGGVIAFGPPAFRDRYRPEIVDTLATALEHERRRQGAFAMASLWLRSVVDAVDPGVFGLVSYLVEQRTREFGIRMTLGARPADIWRSVVSQSVRPAVIGLVLGVASAWALESLVRSAVFGWQSSGPLAVSIVAIALLSLAVFAAAMPARRAMRIDPADVLRSE